MKYLFIFCLLISSTFAAEVTTLTMPLTEGSVKFLAKGRPSAIRIQGTGKPIQGSAQIKGVEVRGNFEVSVESLDTGIGLRTSHMKDKYLEAGKFPKAVFRLTEMKLPSPLTPNGYSVEEVPFSGQLTLHGIQHLVSGKASIETREGKVTTQVHFPVNLSDHGITIPAYLGITVNDVVEVDASFATQMQK